ncbi:MAG: type II secretion system protein J, partial [Desulfovibrionaceae bacterium]
MNPSTSDAPRRNQAGFTLIELIVSVVLLSIIASMAFFFLTTGVSGFLLSRNASKSAMIAQNAATRMTMELRTADGAAGSTIIFSPNSSVTYTSTDSDLPGTRRIHYDSGNQRLYLEVDS